jgi:hypothetical protein
MSRLPSKISKLMSVSLNGLHGTTTMLSRYLLLLAGAASAAAYSFAGVGAPALRLRSEAAVSRKPLRALAALNMVSGDAGKEKLKEFLEEAKGLGKVRAGWQPSRWPIFCRSGTCCLAWRCAAHPQNCMMPPWEALIPKVCAGAPDRAKRRVCHGIDRNAGRPVLCDR